jgi:acetolactate synthase-1/2/3 large subunit
MKMQLSEYVIDCLIKENVKYVFMVSGGGGMFLINALGHRKEINYICNHHEQASAMAAEGYQRVTETIGAALVTTGPAATNAITGVVCAWMDSIPYIIISGQANSKFLIDDTGVRQRGVHEVNIVKMVQSVTKYAVTIRDENEIRYHVEKALYLAKNGRPGPVWLDIPLDIQSKNVDPVELKGFNQNDEKQNNPIINNEDVEKIINLINSCKRPIIIVGNGVRLSKATENLLLFIDKFKIPVVTTKNAMDLIYDNHPFLAGRMGTYGQRAGNFAVQNADLVISLGSRLAFSVVGYAVEKFARDAKKIVIDIDANELKHLKIKADLTVQANLSDFITILMKKLESNYSNHFDKWIEKCQHWRKIFPVVTADMKKDGPYINSYYFYEVLSEELDNDAIVITDQGATFYSATVAFKLKKGQRLFTNGGFSPMGYGLPSSIGACCGNNRKPVVSVNGDGGLQMNIQELQTISHNKLPIKIFVMNNQGYLSIKHTQTAYFDGFLVGSDPNSGVSCPDLKKIAFSYDIPYLKMEKHSQMRDIIHHAFKIDGPCIIEIILDPMQPFEPRVSSIKKADGSLVSKPLEDMFPFLDRDLFNKEMIIKPLDD